MSRCIEVNYLREQNMFLMQLLQNFYGNTLLHNMKIKDDQSRLRRMTVLQNPRLHNEDRIQMNQTEMLPSDQRNIRLEWDFTYFKGTYFFQEKLKERRQPRASLMTFL